MSDGARRAVWLGVAALLTAAPAAACGGQQAGPRGTATIVLNVPESSLPFVAKFTQQGAQLAADQINAKGGVRVGGRAYDLRLVTLDNALSPTTSLANMGRAAADHAVAVIDDGYTAGATFRAAQDAGLPVLVDYNGDAALVDPTGRPNVFRIAPADDAVAQKLVAYVQQKNLKLAVVHDDSDYGRDGDKQLSAAMRSAPPVTDVELPSNATDLSPQALKVVQAGATGVIVWARAPVLAQFVRALRQAGSQAAIFGSPTAEDPVVRTQLADHPDWVQGLTYASFRITTEEGPEDWDAFRKAYEQHDFNNGGPDYLVGVKNSEHRAVVQPPDWQMFPYDMVYLVKAALEKAGTIDPAGGKVISALNEVQVRSANGDQRGWTAENHEGLADDDIYFAHFQDMEFKPVADDPLSRSLPPIDQV